MEKNIGGFILEGVNIGRQTTSVSSIDQLSALHRRYILWISSIKKYFSKKKIVNPQVTCFFENDDVLMAGRRGVGLYIEEEYSQKLLNKISSETSKKIDILRKLSLPKATKTKNKLLLSRDERGDYFYKGKLISLNRNNLYFEILNILYEKSGDGGIITYEEIETELRAKGRSPIEDGRKRDKRIQNSISNTNNGLFRHAEVESKKLPNSNSRGKKLIEIVRGMGVQLNNLSI